MRVGIIVNMKAGLEHFVFREVSFLAARGFSIDLFPTKFGPGLYNAKDEWRLHHWNLFSVLAWQLYFLVSTPIKYLRLLRIAVRYRAFVDFALAWFYSPQMKGVDVLYATFGDHKLYVGFFAKLILNKPLAVTVHAYELYNNPNPALFVEALKSCDQVITVTTYNQELLMEKYGLDPAQIQIVRYSVDHEEYRATPKFVILIVSFFTYRKGHEILLKAVKQLNRDDIEVWIVGDTAGRQGVVDVKGMVKQLGMESQVAFFGALRGTALKAVYRSCELF
jgi:glycosyltransferase involved in cell wall biosynthesis